MSSFIIIGGDKRMLYTAERLGKAQVCGFRKLFPDGSIPEDNSTFTYAVLPPQKSADGINIPCPFSDIPIPYSCLESLLTEGGSVFTGNVCEALKKVCDDNGLRLVNYLEREELAIRNAVLTAEGAVAIAVNEYPCSVFGTEMLVTGFGRIAKILAEYLTAMGAKVTVACRKSYDREWAGIYGCKAVDITDKNAFNTAVSAASVIFNTVPCGIFGNEEISVMKRDTLYIELASADGINAELPEGIRTVTARGLPGKTASVTAGEIIADTILNILSEERGVEYEN